jgi:hypothetical protein
MHNPEYLSDPWASLCLHIGLLVLDFEHFLVVLTEDVSVTDGEGIFRSEHRMMARTAVVPN